MRGRSKEKKGSEKSEKGSRWGKKEKQKERERSVKIVEERGREMHAGRRIERKTKYINKKKKEKKTKNT